MLRWAEVDAITWKEGTPGSHELPFGAGRDAPGPHGPCSLFSQGISAKNRERTYFLEKLMDVFMGCWAPSSTRGWSECSLCAWGRFWPMISKLSFGFPRRCCRSGQAPLRASGSYYMPKSSSQFSVKLLFFSPSALAMLFYYLIRYFFLLIKVSALIIQVLKSYVTVYWFLALWWSSVVVLQGAKEQFVFWPLGCGSLCFIQDVVSSLSPCTGSLINHCNPPPSFLFFSLSNAFPISTSATLLWGGN